MNPSEEQIRADERDRIRRCGVRYLVTAQGYRNNTVKKLMEHMFGKDWDEV